MRMFWIGFFLSSASGNRGLVRSTWNSQKKDSGQKTGIRGSKSHTMQTEFTKGKAAGNHYDVIVIGAGHAGIEAASAAARMGCRTALITLSIEASGRLSCNPAVGGMGKGQLACEIDALGGEMGLLADRSGIQFKTLGKRKGPAMWSPRSQNDKDLYPSFALERLRDIENLDLIEGSVDDIQITQGAIAGVTIDRGRRISRRSVILCAGTFLCGKVHIGEVNRDGGRIDERASHHLTGSLSDVGFETGRLKTGTPPRIRIDSIDLTACSIDTGDNDPRPFSFRSASVQNQIECYTTQTNPETHRILSEGFDRSPMFTGKISGTGPRYCPSVEDKVWRFADKESHHIFLEPEGLTTDSVYVNGFSTSLPEEIQLRALRSIPGLERAEVLRYGYAVEYDYFPPHQLNRWLMSRKVAGLFMAGQVNGTSGYEEAAAQGLIAGINAARYCGGEEGLTIDRADGYIGVLLDDLSTLSTTEPYRLFTSRAEYRLTLRRDNADIRMLRFAGQVGLLPSEQLDGTRRMIAEVERYREKLRRTPARIEAPDGTGISDRAWNLLKRPEISLKDLEFAAEEIAEYPHLNAEGEERGFNAVGPRVREQLEIEARYEGYIARSAEEIAEFRRQEDRVIPEEIDYSRIHSISAEGREKLDRFRPRSLGHASRISGVSRSDLAVLMLYIR